MEAPIIREYKPAFPEASSYLGGDMKQEPKEYGSTAAELPTPANSSPKPSKFKRPNPHRKYSSKWWGHAWDKAVEVGRWPRVTYVAVGLVVVCAWIVVMLVFANEEVKFQRRNSAPVALRGYSLDEIAGLFTYKGTLRKFDPVERSLRISWSVLIIDEDDQGHQTLTDLGSTNETTVALNIYRDVKAVPEDRPINTTLLELIGMTQEQVYRIDNTTQPPIAVVGMHPWDSVDTDIDFTQASPDNAWRQPLFAYPFDRWAGSIVLASTVRRTSEAANLSNSFVFPVMDAMLADSTLNWRISASVNNTCILDTIDAGCELHIDFVGKRPGLVVFSALIAIIVNWTSTIGIFLLTCESVVMRRTYILSEIDILGVCLTALFALPSVRAILPGAPDFGAIIDLIGIIPNIIIISLCTTTIAIARLRMKRPDKEE
ncbi:hypothetical protein CPB86DRAFT_810345 [Serendipita vermifera]|nr:hypothetical protein CPB86DRAFT_810345 [Serendipita vermifera]